MNLFGIFDFRSHRALLVSGGRETDTHSNTLMYIWISMNVYKFTFGLFSCGMQLLIWGSARSDLLLLGIKFAVSKFACFAFVGAALRKFLTSSYLPLGVSNIY